MRHNTIDVITLGCSKNLVDTELLLRRLELAGWRATHDSPDPQGEITVINTCGFIADAQEESINTILARCKAKEEGRVRAVYVMGCLSQRFLNDLKKELPLVDKFYGKFDWPQLLEDIAPRRPAGRMERAVGSPTPPPPFERRLTTPRHYAYLKISEGCDRHCAYCAIPIITGAHKSRPIDEIVAEVRHLVSLGVREFQVIAQELTYYGVDLYGERRIAQLVERVSRVRGVRWIRLHYAYPAQFPWELLRVMRARPNVCKYLDIALQHVSTNVLGRMRRHIDKEATYELVRRLRAEVPGITLRTTLMVGFPGEGEAEFAELKDFVRWARFERMGAFAYSEELGTPAQRAHPDTVPAAVKRRRLEELMRIQQGISAEVQGARVGQTLPVVIDRREGGYYVGRTEFDTPEVDPEVLIASGGRPLRRGCFYKVLITGSDDFDLYGEVR